MAAAVPILSTETQRERRIETLGAAARELLQLADERAVEDVVVNPDGSLWVNRTGEGFRFLRRMPEAEVKAILLRIAYEQELPFGASHPVLETDIPVTGARITGLCRPIVRGAALAIRPHPKVRYTKDDYLAAGIVTRLDDARNVKGERARFLDLVRGKDHGEILSLAIQHRRNILVGGSTGSGKTTFMNMLFSEIGRLRPHDRVIGIEDTAELQWHDVKNHVALLAANGISGAQCLKTALRLKPHVIAVGEVRTRAMTRALVNALNTGHDGGIATVHCDDAPSALQRLEELLGRGNRPSIARAIHMVLFIDESDQVAAGRKLREVLVVHGYDKEKGEYQLEAV